MSAGAKPALSRGIGSDRTGARSIPGRAVRIGWNPNAGPAARSGPAHLSGGDVLRRGIPDDDECPGAGLPSGTGRRCEADRALLHALAGLPAPAPDLRGMDLGFDRAAAGDADRKHCWRAHHRGLRRQQVVGDGALGSRPRKPHGLLGTTACLHPLAGSSWLSQAACSLARVCSGLASSPIRGLGTWGSS